MHRPRLPQGLQRVGHAGLRTQMPAQKRKLAADARQPPTSSPAAPSPCTSAWALGPYLRCHLVVAASLARPRHPDAAGRSPACRRGRCTARRAWQQRKPLRCRALPHPRSPACRRRASWRHALPGTWRRRLQHPLPQLTAASGGCPATASIWHAHSCALPLCWLRCPRWWVVCMTNGMSACSL